jgi:hypothetical protein
MANLSLCDTWHPNLSVAQLGNWNLIFSPYVILHGMKIEKALIIVVYFGKCSKMEIESYISFF